jgi:hypothetical protein
MASIETCVRAMLTSATSLNALPDARIMHGFRLQDTILPAITFEVAQDEYMAIGSTPLKMASVELRVIASTTTSALSYESAVKSAVRTGTFDTIVVSAVDFVGRYVEPPVVADGDETEPAQLVCNFTVYYKD